MKKHEYLNNARDFGLLNDSNSFRERDCTGGTGANTEPAAEALFGIVDQTSIHHLPGAEMASISADPTATT